MFEISRRVFLELFGAAAAGATMASGKLSDAADAAVRLVRPRPWYERGTVQQTYSYCDMCLWKCGTIVSTVNGQVVKIDGTVTTVMQDGQPKTTFKGNYTIAADEGTLGINGQGTYSGYFTAEDKFHVDWEGTRTVQKDAMNSPGKN